MTMPTFVRMAAPVLAGAVALGLVGVGTAGLQGDLCSETHRGRADHTSRVADGAVPAAGHVDRIVLLDEDDREGYTHAGAEQGVLRHMSRSQGQGTAYVNDLDGPDRVVAVTRGGLLEHRASGEVTHPAWSSNGRVAWALDLSALEVWTPSTGAVRTVPAPPGSTGIFSPVFVDNRRIVAVVQQPVSGALTHDDTVNNLWRHDLADGSWTRLTRFGASGDAWTAIRTPVLDAEGNVLFVRVVGNGAATERPSFELWKLSGSTASRVRNLPGERYLAEAGPAGILWNIDDGSQWRLYRETGSSLVDLGCGSIQVDPRYEEDADLLVEDEEDADPEGDEGPGSEDPTDTALRTTPDDGSEATDPLLALVVGDFATREEARAAADDIGLEGLEVVGHGVAPGAVAPGMYAVASRLGPGEDPEAALGSFRARFPAYADRTWVASLAGG